MRCSRASSAIGTVWLTIFIRPPPTSFLYFTSAMSGSTPVVLVHHEPDGAGRRQHRRLGVAEAVLLAHLDDFVPHRLRRLHQFLRHVRLVDVLERRAMFAHHPQERLAVDLVAGERAAVIARDPRRLRVGGAVHDRGDRRRVVTAGVAVGRHAARHQQRAEIGVAEAERTEVVAVLLDRLGRIARSCRPGSPAP